MSLGMIFALDAKIGMLDQEKSSRIFPEYEGGSTVGHVCLHFLTFTCFILRYFLMEVNLPICLKQIMTGWMRKAGSS